MAHLLAYGDSTYRFKDLPMSMYSMYRSLFGDFDFMEMFLGNRIIGPAFFIIWTLIGLVVLFNMFVAIIMESYEATKEPGDGPDVMSMLEESFMKPMQESVQALMRKVRAGHDCRGAAQLLLTSGVYSYILHEEIWHTLYNSVH